MENVKAFDVKLTFEDKAAMEAIFHQDKVTACFLLGSPVQLLNDVQGKAMRGCWGLPGLDVRSASVLEATLPMMDKGDDNVGGFALRIAVHIQNLLCLGSLMRLQGFRCAVPYAVLWLPELTLGGLLLLQVAGERYDPHMMKTGWRSGVTASTA